MSKERELLKRVRDVLRGLEDTHYDLYWDIQAELEKIEHKHNNVGYLYKQKDCYGEIETVFSFDKPYITWHNVTDVTAVYLAPQKREPLSEDEIFNLGYNAGFTLDHVRDDDGSVYGFLNEYGYIDNTRYFKFVRAIEKAHGVGVENEN
jgi:hypothetical protein